MTTIRTSSPLKRETSSTIRRRGKERPLVVELHAGYLLIGPKGLKSERYMLEWTAAYHAAAKCASRNGR